MTGDTIYLSGKPTGVLSINGEVAKLASYIYDLYLGPEIYGAFNMGLAMFSSWWKYSELVKVLRISDHKCSAIDESLVSTLPIQVSLNTEEECVEMM